MVAVADSIEVMASRQLYRQPRSQPGDPRRAAGRLREAEWDPQIVVDVALELFESGELAVRDQAVQLSELEPEALLGDLERPRPGGCVTALQAPA